MRVVSTFSGCGGSSEGYKSAGLEVVAAVEFLEWQRVNYRANHRATKVLPLDMRYADPDRVLREIGLAAGELDVLDGSPPCSDFSVMGKTSKGWGKVKSYSSTEQRVDDLFFQFARLAAGLMPRVIVGENVKGLTMGASRGYFRQIMEAFRDLGYVVKAKLMNAVYYGVPQTRERIIFLCVREDLGVEPQFPRPAPTVTTLREALDGCPGPTEVEETIPTSEKMRRLWEMTPRGQSFQGAAETDHGQHGWYNWQRLAWDQPSPTVIQGSNVLLHPDEPRRLTIPELRRVSGFPDGYKLFGSFSKRWEAIGRAVPPPMMRAVGEQIRRLLGE